MFTSNWTPLLRAQAFLWLLCIASSLQGETARCIKVIDGDSLVLRLSFGDQEARLEGIDAPEGAQRFGAQAERSLADLVLDKAVEVAIVGADTYGRFLVRLRIGEVDVNAEMVRRGLAWHFKKYSVDAELAQAEVVARRDHVGLWADDSPIPPWEYRHPAAMTPLPAAQLDLPESQEQLEGGAGPGLLHGNRSSHVFHLPSCINYSCRNCVVAFASEKEAIHAGFRPAGCCARRPKP